MLSVYAQYPTFTVFLAVFVGAIVTMLLMPLWIKGLKKHLIGQQVRADGPESHLVKQGTPTMGGVIMLVAMAITVLLLAAPELDTIFILVAIILTGVLGFIDDASKVAKERSLGLTPKAKLIGQFLISTAFVLAVVNWLGIPPTIDIPFITTLDFGILTTTLPIEVPAGQFSIPWLYVIFCDILLMGLSNATNLTDGLDGLAAGTVMMAILVMAAISYRLDLLDASIVSAAIAGCCVGFLWFNAYPADIFMGDTGSLALGMALGCVAIVTKTEVISLIIGGLFVIEALSVMIQVFYFKRTRKRLFLMAPLHHHFEKKGWSEVKVVVRFWIISAFLAAVGFSIFFAQSMMG
ncbi:phospho-N-acetylmuramoyl-pentapeptide-transferase [Anaerotardibacter muris]|uniref:phospho-N-acetylmuramoyl-pentapeptide- transferase n=1 Tax=Anaerotardibacter muris TaxID=2941505 RepID=UPI00203F3907|nr:phospho-N-acetylmuramoyl-pentapeptide-transferase [Anaerotardibacter muris]